MKINFKGTYFISGNTILNDPVVKVKNFLSETKDYRYDKGKSYINRDTFDYYIGVKDEKEKDFENVAQKYKIEMKKGDVHDSFIYVEGNKVDSECEFDSLFEVIIKCRKV